MRGKWQRIADRGEPRRGVAMVATVLVVMLVVLLFGALPSWSYSRDWGYYPGGFLGVALLVTIVLILTGRM